MDIPEEFFEVVRKGGFEMLPLTIPQIEQYRILPLHHRDPFDRMLIIQARQQKLIFITRDSEINKYASDPASPSGARECARVEIVKA